MRRVWKRLGIGIAFFAGLGLMGALVFYVVSESVISRHYALPPSDLRAATGSHAVARGRHLAMAYGCTDCHTTTLQGTFIPDFGVASRNLTRLAATFSDADFDRAVRKGLRPDGRSVAEFMPSDAFQFMPDDDIAEIIAYIRSLKPSGDDVPFPTFDFKARLAFLRGDSHMDQYWFGIQKPALNVGPQFARGRTLAMTACGECHTTALTGGTPDTPPPRPPDLSLVASYERSDFVTLMRTGKAAGNRELPLMSATARARFSHFSDHELGAIYDYLAARGRKFTGVADAKRSRP